MHNKKAKHLCWDRNFFYDKTVLMRRQLPIFLRAVNKEGKIALLDATSFLTNL